MNTIIIGIISALGGIGITIAFFLFVFSNPDKAEKWLALVLRALAFIGIRFKRQLIKRDIQSSLNSYVARLSEDTEIQEVGVKIQWTGRGKDEDIQWKDGEVVLVMRDKGHRNRNFVHAAYLFTSTSLLKNIKVHLSKKQSVSLDVFTTGKILEEENPAALQYFASDIANTLLKDEKVQALVEQFTDIDKSGFYTHVLLQELQYLGGKVIFSKQKSAVYEEVGKLIEFLQNFATREVGDDSIPETFVGTFLKSSIKIVSTAPVRALGRTDGPADRVCRAFEKGIENVYVIGPHQDGKLFIDSVCETVKVKRDDVELVKSRRFKGVVTIEGVPIVTDTYLVQLQSIGKRKLLDSRDINNDIDQYREEFQRLDPVED